MKHFFTFFILFTCFLTFSQTRKDSVYVFYFKPAIYDLPGDSLVQFQKFYKKFESCKTCNFELQGYADKHGDTKSNLILAGKRISFVKTLLVKTDSSRIRDLPFGEKFSQHAINHQDYRKVMLQVKNKPIKPVSTTKISETGNTSKTGEQGNVVLTPEEYNKQVAAAKAKIPDTLTKEEVRIVEFSERNKAIILCIQFELNTTNLLPESLDDLVVLRKYLQEHPKLKAKLIGHVCCSNDYELSRNRAYQIYFYLYKKGINRDRLSYEGKSNRVPLVVETTPAAEQINRRVEVIFYE